MPRFYYIKRIVQDSQGRIKDIGVIDIPEKDLETTLKNNPMWKVVEEVDTDNPIVPKADANVSLTGGLVKKPVEFACPICGFVAQTAFGLKTHKRKHDPKQVL